jgi:hypothetical protein
LFSCLLVIFWNCVLLLIWKKKISCFVFNFNPYILWLYTIALEIMRKEGHFKAKFRCYIIHTHTYTPWFHGSLYLEWKKKLHMEGCIETGNFLCIYSIFDSGWGSLYIKYKILENSISLYKSVYWPRIVWVNFQCLKLMRLSETILS